MTCDPCQAKQHPDCVGSTVDVTVPRQRCDCACDPTTWTEVPFERRYTWRERALLGEHHEVECLLAEALGYPYDDEYGWAVGDHTPVTLAMEARRRGIIPDAPPDIPGVATDLAPGDAAFIAARAAYYAWSVAPAHTPAASAAFRAWVAAIGVGRRLDEQARARGERARAISAYVAAGNVWLPPADIEPAT